MESIQFASSSREIICHEWPGGNACNAYKSSTNEIDPINSISWGKNSPWLVYVSRQGRAEIISFEGPPKTLSTINAIEHPTCASFQNLTKRSIAIGSIDGGLFLYDVKTKQIKKTFTYACDSLFKVQYGLKDSHVFSGCESGELLVYNSNSALMSCRFRVPNSQTLTNFRCHPYRRNLVAGCSEEGIVAVWDINTSNTLMCSHNHNLPITDVAFSKQQSLLACIAMDRRICLTDRNAGNVVVDQKFDKVPTAVEFSSDGIGFVVGFQNGQLQSYDLRDTTEATDQFLGHNARVNQIVFQRITKEGSCFSLPEDTALTSRKSPERDSFDIYRLDILPESDTEKGNASETTCDQSCDSLVVSLTPRSKSGNFISLGITDGVRKLMDEKPNLLESPPAGPKINFLNASTIEDKETKTDNQISEVYRAYSSLPPSCGITKQAADLSSIYKHVFEINKPDIRQMIKEVAREVIKEEQEDIRRVVTEELDKLKKFIEYQNYAQSSSTRSQFLDLQMSIVKESIKVEDNLNFLYDKL